MGFRRMVLLGTSVFLSVMLSVVLCQQAAAQLQKAEPQTRTKPVAFPYGVKHTNLVVVEQALYDGPFLEDGSTQEVACAMALVVRNAGIRQIARGHVVLAGSSGCWIFEVFDLPPGESALVLERSGKTGIGEGVFFCVGWEELADTEPTPGIRIQEVGMGTLRVTNLTDDRQEGIQIRFKTYDEESGMYLGGITYEANVDYLDPGDTVEVTPYYYVSGRSRIVAIKTKQAPELPAQELVGS